MRILNGHIAGRAKAENRVKGHFQEGRSESQALLSCRVPDDCIAGLSNRANIYLCIGLFSSAEVSALALN